MPSRRRGVDTVDRRVRGASAAERVALAARALVCIFFALLLALACESNPARASADAPTDPALLRQIANQILATDASDVSGFFRMVRQANPSKGAIKTMREINKAMQEEEDAIKEGRRKPTDPRVYSAQEKTALEDKFKQAQTLVKDTILRSRQEALAKFAEDHPDLVRFLTAFGDIGSWRTSTDVNSDADYTVYGVDPRINHLFVYQYLAPMLIQALDGLSSVLNLADDFDIVPTAEGHESEAKVFESEGGKMLAATVMTSLTPINADGTLGAPAQKDIAAALVNVRKMGELRMLATQQGVYDTMFDAKGMFKSTVLPGPDSTTQRPTFVVDPAQKDQLEQFFELADDEGLLVYDTKLTKSETLAGTCVDMAKHLNHEAIQQLSGLDKNGQIKRIMKYPGRSQWAYGKAHLSDQLIEDYIVRGDPRIRKLIQQSEDFHRVKEAKGEGAKEALKAKVEELAAAYPDSEELGALALTLIVRQAHLAIHARIDDIMKMATADLRGAAIALPTPSPSDSGAKSCQDLITLGGAAERKGDQAGAADLFTKAIALCPQRCDAMDELVSIMRKRGDAAEAQAMTKRSRSCWDNL